MCSHDNVMSDAHFAEATSGHLPNAAGVRIYRLAEFATLFQAALYHLVFF